MSIWRSYLCFRDQPHLSMVSMLWVSLPFLISEVVVAGRPELGPAFYCSLVCCCLPLPSHFPFALQEIRGALPYFSNLSSHSFYPCACCYWNHPFPKPLSLPWAVRNEPPCVISSSSLLSFSTKAVAWLLSLWTLLRSVFLGLATAWTLPFWTLV